MVFSVPHLNLTRKDIEDFARLKISEDLLELAHIERLSDQQARDYGITRSGDMSGLLFPYFLPGGNGHVTCRLRRDHPEIEDGKPKDKYIAPYGDARHLYFPPQASEFLADPETPIVFVEAEKSSLAVTAWSERIGRPMLAVATGGCWGWRGRVGKTADASGARVDEKGPLSDLQYAEGRKTYILFDANAADNKDVQKARRAFVKVLKKKFKASEVVILDLPSGDWNGPDDFVGANDDAALLAVFTPREEPQDTRPIVIVRPGEAPGAVDLAENILVDHALELKLFQRSGEVVHVVTVPQLRKESGLVLPAGTVIVEPVSRCTLQEIFDRLICFQKLEEDTPRAVDCPTKIADSYLSRTGSRRLPVLMGTIFAPAIREDGTLLQKPGYDAQTGLFFVSHADWADIPQQPTREDAEQALAVLLGPFSEFPFCSEADKATHVAAIATALQRRLLPTAPLFAYRAPERRTGKSLLAESVAIIATGRPAPATAVSGEAEEFRKAVTAALYRGHPVINLDNIETVLNSPFLSMALTQESYEDRILGESRMIQLPTRTLWTCTGNNLTLKGDLTVRTVLCSIDADNERPEERIFKIADLRRFLLEHRPKLVCAALTILRAYHVANMPKQDVAPWGGFDTWSRTIREAIVWTGLPDPAKTREGIVEDDPDREAALMLLHALRQGFADEPFTVKQIMERVEPPEDTTGRPVITPDADLLNALSAVAIRRGGISRQAIGFWCHRWRDRVLDGLQLRAAGQEHKSAKWKIVVKADA